MYLRKTYFAFLVILLFGCAIQKNALPDSFVYINDVIPNIAVDVRYAGENNFMGVPVNSYERPVIITTRECAIALKKVEQDLNQQGLGLKIFDAYRPQSAVNHFIKWAKIPSDTLTKHIFYPDLPKSRLFELGYIAERSGHTRGSTVDLTIIQLDNGIELDMGSPWDYFGPISHHDTHAITPKQKENRLLLKNTMMKYDFLPYSEEWWHYTLDNEPYPDTYFDFPVR